MEFKNRNPRQRRPVFDDIPSARWLDDSVWDKTRRRSSVSTSVSSRKKKDLNKAINLNINIAAPKITADRLKDLSSGLRHRLNSFYVFFKNFRTAPSRSAYIKEYKYQALASSICLVVIIVVLATTIITSIEKDSGVQGAATASSQATNVSEPTNEPLFETVKPAGRELKKEDVVFDPQRKFAKFTDEVNGVPVIVSQQPMPEIYRSSPNDGAAKIAKDFGAAELITFDGQQMYFGQDEKGPMTMIFAKKENLVFVVTVRAVDKEALKVYVGNFE